MITIGPILAQVTEHYTDICVSYQGRSDLVESSDTDEICDIRLGPSGVEFYILHNGQELQLHACEFLPDNMFTLSSADINAVAFTQEDNK